jgi:hypothetical protein
LDKPLVTMEGWIVAYRGNAPWFLTGFATGHPRLQGFRRFIHSSEIQKFDAAHGCAETRNTVYDLRHRLEDLVIDHLGSLSQARILDLTARRGDLPNEWFIIRGAQVVEQVWATEFYEVVPKLLAMVSRSSSN